MPSVGQIWQLKGFHKYVFILEVTPHYIGRTKTGNDVRYKAVDLLNNNDSAILDAYTFRDRYEWVNG